jgi:hypothetical protein
MAENLFCTMPPARDVEAHGGPGNLSGHPRAGSLLRHPKFDLRAQLEPFARDLGFGLFAFLALQGYGADPTDYSLQCYVSNYPEPWKARYEHEGLHHQDPIVAIGGLKREIFAWYARDPDLCLTDMHQRLVETMCAYRLFCGITVPVHGPRGEAETGLPVIDPCREGAGRLVDILQTFREQKVAAE